MPESDAPHVAIMERISRIGLEATKVTLAILLGVSLYLLTVNLVVFPHPLTAQATAAQPATDWSFYITTSDATTLFNLGCNQADFDASFSPHINSLVVLDFGIQNSAGTGVVTTFKRVSLPNSQVDYLSYQFSDGYWSCRGSDTTSVLTLGVGTNDSDPSYSDATYTALGKDWANIVQGIKSDDAGFASQIKVWGANDLEAWHYSTGQVTPDQGNAWVNGYASIYPAPYVNYGDAIGCPTSYTSGQGAPCSYGYHQGDYYFYSWGAAPALVAPEIYTASNPNNPGQWANISLYATHVKNAPMYFEGPWDEHPFNSSELTASQAWSDFWNALNSAGVNPAMSYSLEIHCEVSGACQ